MILSNDVIDDETGEIIALKDRPVDFDTLVRLKAFYMDVMDRKPDGGTAVDISEEDEAILSGSIPYLPEKERQNYVDFKNTYVSSFEKTKDLLGDIQMGVLPDVSELGSVTDDIISTVRRKSDVFAYLNYMNSLGSFVYDHSVCVSLVCRVFADWLRLSTDESDTLAAAGLLHDIGMLKIADNIVNKKEKLTHEEYMKITMHPTYGYNMLKDCDIADEIKFAVLQHHERIDASGYPNRLKYDQIHRFGKIIGIVDVFAAMIYDRPYREKFAPFEVIKTFEREFLGKLDTEFLMVFLQNIAYNYIDRSVRLSNGKIGTIVFINKAQCSAPIIKLEDDNYIDLMFDKTVQIAEVL
jgi:putative nucleotidyltransferase with HDIG domain